MQIARRRPALTPAIVILLASTAMLAACEAAAPAGTPPISPGTSVAPRDVNIIARDYAFVPAAVDLVPGETVILRVVNAGLDVHEAVVGDLEAQLAWEAAEGATVDSPPGPTPVVAAPPGFVGVRVVVESGQRLDVSWTVPADAASAGAAWFVGCHIPGHWQKGMVVPVRFVDGSGRPLATGSPAPVGTGAGS